MVGVEDTGREAVEKEAIELARKMEAITVTHDSDDEWEDDAGEEAEAEKVAQVMETVLTVTADELSTTEIS
jgi:predicted nuclease of predicted toxin-antitoxin system